MGVAKKKVEYPARVEIAAATAAEEEVEAESLENFGRESNCFFDEDDGKVFQQQKKKKKKKQKKQKKLHEFVGEKVVQKKCHSTARDRRRPCAAYLRVATKKE